MTSDVQERQSKLDRFLVSVLHDDSKINSSRQAALFIEAICIQDDATLLADKLINYPKGLDALRKSVCQDISPTFLGGPAAQLLAKLSDSALASLDSGNVLCKILDALLQPTFFWSACIEQLKSRALSPSMTRNVAWVLSEVLRLYPLDKVAPYLTCAVDEAVINVIQNADDDETRAYGHHIKHRAGRRLTSSDVLEDGNSPGGRHDNDAKNIADIKIIPTRDEILSPFPAFLRTANDVFGCPTLEERRLRYIDHMFRLLRDDLVHDFRDKLKSPADKPAVRRGLAIRSARLTAIHCDALDIGRPSKRQPWGACFRIPTAFPGTAKMSVKQRQAFLEDRHGRGSRILQHDSLVAITENGKPLGFGHVTRFADRLSQDSCEIVLRLDQSSSEAVFARAFIGTGTPFDLFQLDTPLFAYEPFLRKLQHFENLELVDTLLDDSTDLSINGPSTALERLVLSIREGNDAETARLLKTSKALQLDESQRTALLCGLSNRIGLIQGPPGTGKSFIGALIARALHDNIDGTIMVICYTNHALDQFTEDLMDVGIPQGAIVRLGSKSSIRTAPLLLKNQQQVAGLTRHDWGRINDTVTQMKKLSHQMIRSLQRCRARVSAEEILEHLEFHVDGSYFEALHIPEEEDGMSLVGQKGRAADKGYLLQRWLKGAKGPGSITHHSWISQSKVWQLPEKSRHDLHESWVQTIRGHHIEDLQKAGQSYNLLQQSIQSVFRSKDALVLGNKRIVACTSTYAAMSSDILGRVRPEVVLLEEAGELLEPHVLTALSASTRRLVMIGDHKQLRPTVTNYALQVESGNGLDLNRSLFERLILAGFPHASLAKQHRMRPEISDLVRQLTYPHLENAASTMSRPDIRGLQQNVVFVDHREPEGSLEVMTERRPGSSKQNHHEAVLALRYVKYLAQQGYGSEDIVVLTPYLGQLNLLRDTLSAENDPVLNDLDNHDLHQAGLGTVGTATTPPEPKGRRVHLSSVDNYQGDEKKIVIASLTRGNATGDIGFMSAPERLNVLLSRARDGLILIGNLSTFTSAKKGKELWTSFRNHINRSGYICQGLPIQCQSHPDVKNVAVTPNDFPALCPDGGCSKPCNEILACGQHKCPSRCHILVDHLKMICPEVIRSQCPRGHTQTRQCQSQKSTTCATCKKLDEERKRRAHALWVQAQNNETEERRHALEMDELDEEISLIKQETAHVNLGGDRGEMVSTKKADLAKVRSQLQKAREKQSKAAASAAADEATSDSQKDIYPSNPTRVEDLSPSQTEWRRQKVVEGQTNDSMDRLMEMVGLEDVKRHVLDLKAQIEVKQRQNVNVAGERYHVAFLGNPGTGKTTVARLWTQLLHSLDVIPGDAFEETTGSKLATQGVPQAQKHIDELMSSGGGVMFVDEAYQLTSGGANASGKNVLDFLLGEIENRRGTIVFVFAGYKQPMETFFSHNTGIPSRIPYSFEFQDYCEADLLHMLRRLFEKRFRNDAHVMGGLDGLFMRIVARRLSRQRDTEGFGNMRDLENIFNQICARQARRLHQARTKGGRPDDFTFIQEDMIGPEPSSAILSSSAWTQLQNLVGLTDVKASVQTLVAMLSTNYQRELDEKQPIQVSLNKVFLGSPGTGKTSVAKLYGRLLADIGLLSHGDGMYQASLCKAVTDFEITVVAKTPADFIGSALGVSEQNTNAILDSSKGKVLIIDEAYMLDASQGSEGATASDPFRTAVVDTIVSKVHNVPGDDRCVLLLGYDEQMQTMFQHINPGFTRRFPLDDAFRFEDFNDQELLTILETKLKSQDLTSTADGKKTAMDFLIRAKNTLNFGNAGEVENLISKAKINRQKRMRSGSVGAFELDAIDFDPDFARATSADERLWELFKDTVGTEEVVALLRQYQSIAANVKQAGLPVKDHLPFNFVFKGPPGTGKTSTARKIGQVYYDMGFLQRVEVVECSVSDLVGQFVGQTGPKTRKQLEKGLGKVLFIDEAYRLGEGHFATEAVNELTDLLTKPQFKGKLVVVLAGYEDEMNSLVSVNPGLASRFPETIMFKSLTPTQCLGLFAKQLQQNGLHCSSLGDAESDESSDLLLAFEQLSELKFWGNGRDVQNMSKKVMRYAFGRTHQPGEDPKSIPHDFVLKTLSEELSARRKTEAGSRNGFQSTEPLPPLQIRGPQNAPASPPTATTQATAQSPPEEDHVPSEEDTPSGDQRDRGVSDATWTRLQADIAAASEQRKQDASLLHALDAQAHAAARALAETDERIFERSIAGGKDERGGYGLDSDSGSDSDDDAAAEDRRRRLRALEAERLQRQKLLEERDRQERERKREAAAQKKLRSLGVCPVGYPWHKQAGGYRCAGGSHFVADGQLDLGG